MVNLPKGTELNNALKGIAAEPMVPDAVLAADEETDAAAKKFKNDIKNQVPDSMPGGM